MHEVAILGNDDPNLGKAGKPVSIGAVEKVYKNSASAKVNSYRCANERCGVNVVAVIPDINKPGRIKSPCAYFSAKPKSHIKGCSRQPVESEPKGTPPDKQPEFNSARIEAPTIWVDPNKALQTKGTDGQKEDSSNTGDGTTKSSDSSGLGGRSASRSQLVERFATAWRSMSIHERRNTPLSANWNSGGSYYSAFLPLRYYPKIDLTNRRERIVVGTLASIYKGESGYILTLEETDASGLELKFWIQNATFNAGTSGRELHGQLSSIEMNPGYYKGREVFVFGNFRKQHSKNRLREWLSLSINRPSMIWIS